MHRSIQKIIAVLNHFSMCDEVLEKTFDFAQKHDASVEILYVHETPLFDVPDFFGTNVAGILDKDKIKKEIEAKIATLKPSITPAIFVKIDDTPDRVWALAREDKKTFVITAYHEKITKKLIQKIKQPLLVLKTSSPRYSKIALVIDAVSNAHACIQNVQHYFKQGQIELIYDYRYIVDPGMEASIQNVQIIQKAQEEAFETLKKKYALDGEFFIDGGFLGTQMSAYLKEKNFELLYICSRVDDFFVSNDLAIDLLTTLQCDALIAND